MRRSFFFSCGRNGRTITVFMLGLHVGRTSRTPIWRLLFLPLARSCTTFEHYGGCGVRNLSAGSGTSSRVGMLDRLSALCLIASTVFAASALTALAPLPFFLPFAVFLRAIGHCSIRIV